jgi:hypothetical protein
MKTNLIKWASAALLLINVFTLQAQTTYTVDNTPNSGAQFSDIQSAINAASNGDTIYVQQSVTSYDRFVIDKQLTIIGRGYVNNLYVTTINNSTLQGSIVLDANSSGTKISGLKIALLATDGINSVNNIIIQDCFIDTISVSNAPPSILYNNWLVEGCKLGGASFGSNSSNVTIRNNFFELNSGFIESLNPSSFLLVNNVIRLGFTGGSFIRQIQNTADVINITDNIIEIPGNTLSIRDNFQINNCLLSNYSDRTQTVTVSSSATIQNIRNSITAQDPLFVAPFDQNTQPIPDFNLLPNSPAIGAGVNGGNIGYRANFVFKRFGNPKGIPEVKITNYQSIAPQNGTVTFDIEARSH